MKYLFILFLLFSQLEVFPQNQKVSNKKKPIVDSVEYKKEWSNLEFFDDIKLVGFMLPPFKGVDLKGSVFESTTTKRIVFYNFWFSTCTPCIDEIPMLNRIEKVYHGKVDFISITFTGQDSIIINEIGRSFNFRTVYMDRVAIQKLNITKGFPTNAIVVDGKVVYCTHGGLVRGIKQYELISKVLENKFKNKIECALNGCSQ